MIKNKIKSLLLGGIIGSTIVFQGVSCLATTTAQNQVLLSSGPSSCECTCDCTHTNGCTIKCETGLITASKLNVRDDFSAKSNIIGVLAKGTKVDVVYRECNGWYMIKFEDGYAYVSGDYLTILNDNSSPKNRIIKTSTVKASKLNVRTGCSTSDDIIGTLKKGDIVEIVSKNNGWYKIKYYNSYAYVSAAYIN